MKMFAAILLTFVALQDKTIQPPPAQSSEQKSVEQKAENPQPVVLPQAKPVQLKITDGTAPALETARPAAMQTLLQEEKTIRVRINADQLQQMIAEKLSQTSSVKTGIVFENGAFYIKTEGFTFPMSGGGASGCLGTASRGKITFHDPAIQRMIEAEKAPATEKK